MLRVGRHPLGYLALLVLGLGSLGAMDQAEATPTDPRGAAYHLLDRSQRGLPIPNCLAWTLPETLHRPRSHASCTGWMLAGNAYRLTFTCLRQQASGLVATTLVCHPEHGTSAYVEGTVTQGSWFVSPETQVGLGTMLAWMQQCHVTESPPAEPYAFHDPIIHAMDLEVGEATPLRGFFCGVPRCPGELEALIPTAVSFAITEALSANPFQGPTLPSAPDASCAWALHRLLAGVDAAHPLPAWVRQQLWLMAGHTRDPDLAPVLLRQIRRSTAIGPGASEDSPEEDRVRHAAASGLAELTGKDYRLTAAGKDRPLGLVEADYRFLLQRGTSGRLHAP